MRMKYFGIQIVITCSNYPIVDPVWFPVGHHFLLNTMSQPLSDHLVSCICLVWLNQHHNGWMLGSPARQGTPGMRLSSRSRSCEVFIADTLNVVVVLMDQQWLEKLESVETGWSCLNLCDGCDYDLIIALALKSLSDTDFFWVW